MWDWPQTWSVVSFVAWLLNERLGLRAHCSPFTPTKAEISRSFFGPLQQHPYWETEYLSWVTRWCVWNSEISGQLWQCFVPIQSTLLHLNLQMEEFKSVWLNKNQVSLPLCLSQSIFVVLFEFVAKCSAVPFLLYSSNSHSLSPPSSSNAFSLLSSEQDNPSTSGCRLVHWTPHWKLLLVYQQHYLQTQRTKIITAKLLLLPPFSMTWSKGFFCAYKRHISL